MEAPGEEIQHEAPPPGKLPKRMPPEIPKHVTFFERMAKIPEADWGTRATIRIYRLEPIIDRTRGSSTKYITVYTEAVTEEKIKADHGSGRYRLYLNYKEPGAREGKEMDSVEIDILDMAFPPIVPDSEWVDDPRNKRWAWARPANTNGRQQQAMDGQQNGTNFMLDAMRVQNEALRVQNDIRKSTVEEIRASQPPPPPPPPDPLQTLRAAKEILTPPTDNTLLTTIVTLMTKQVEASAAEAKELRAEIRQTRDGNGGNTIDKIVKGVNDLLPVIEKIWPAAKDGINRVRPVRSNMSGWQEFLQPIIPAAMNSPFWNVLAAAITRPTTPAPNMPNIPPPTITAGQPQQNGARQQQPLDPISLWNDIARPMLNYLAVDADPAKLGDEFACWVYDGFAADPRYDQVMQMARMMGTQQVIAFMQQQPILWSHLASQQARFTTFLDAFLKWAPETDDDEPATDEVIDVSDEQEAAHHA